MPKITRYVQNLFGNLVGAAGNFGKFGSLAAGTPTFTKDPKEIQSLPAWNLGWNAATVGNKSPALQDRNALDFLIFYQLTYLLQQGIPEWNADTTYFQNQFVASAGSIYISKTNDNLNNAVSDTNNWNPLFRRQQTALAWAFFTGTSGGTAIVNSFNINGITRDNVGAYTLTFETPMLNTNYVIIANGVAFGTVPPWQRGQFLNEFVDESGVPSKTVNDFGLQAGSESDTAEDCLRGYVVIYGN